MWQFKNVNKNYLDELWFLAVSNEREFGVSALGQIAISLVEGCDGDPRDGNNWGKSAIALACKNICGLNGYPEVISNTRVKSLVDPSKPTRRHDTQQWVAGKMTDSPDEVFLNFIRRSSSLTVWCMWGRGFFFPGKDGRYKNNQADAKTADGFKTFVNNMVRDIGGDKGWCPTPGYLDNVMEAYAGLVNLSWTPPASGTPSPVPDAQERPYTWDPKVTDRIHVVLSTKNDAPVLSFKTPISLESDKLTAIEYDLDTLEDHPEFVKEAHAAGVKVIAYISVGSWEKDRKDSSKFPASVKGSKMKGWPEYWLDIRNPVVYELMKNRFTRAEKLGCDAVDPDNIDGAWNDTGFPLKPEDSIAYVRKLARRAHKRGLRIAQKNSTDMVSKLVNLCDFAVVEEAAKYNETDAFAPYLKAGKPVVWIEYDNSSFLKTHPGPGYVQLRDADLFPDVKNERKV